jgi:hypothetical protein
MGFRAGTISEGIISEWKELSIKIRGREEDPEWGEVLVEIA